MTSWCLADENGERTIDCQHLTHVAVSRGTSEIVHGACRLGEDA